MADITESCAQYIPILDAYRDGELAGEEKSRVQAHLADCDSCSKRVDEINRLVSVLKGLPPITAPRDYADNLESILAKSQAQTKVDNIASLNSTTAKRPFIWVAAVAASLLLTVGLARLITSNHSSELATVDMSKKSVALAPSENIQTNSEPTSSAKDDASNAAGQKSESNKTNAGSPAAPKTLPASVFPAGRSSQQPKRPQIASKNGNSESTGGIDQTGSHTDTDNAGRSLVAYYEQPEQTTIPEALGITTDEDGLYAIKM